MNEKLLIQKLQNVNAGKYKNDAFNLFINLFIYFAIVYIDLSIY